jgi:hypothetical protein
MAWIPKKKTLKFNHQLMDLLIIGTGTFLIFALTYLFTPKPVNK